MSHEDLTAAKVPFKLGELEILCNRLTDRDVSELNEWVRREFMRSVMESLRGIDDYEFRAEAISSATSQMPGLAWTHGVGHSIMATIDGVSRLLWQACYRNAPKPTFELIKQNYSKVAGKPDNGVKELVTQIRPRAPETAEGNDEGAASREPS